MNRSDAMTLARAIRTVRQVRLPRDAYRAQRIVTLLVEEIADTLSDGREGWDAKLFRTQCDPDTAWSGFEEKWPDPRPYKRPVIVLAQTRSA